MDMLDRPLRTVADLRQALADLPPQATVQGEVAPFDHGVMITKITGNRFSIVSAKPGKEGK